MFSLFCGLWDFMFRKEELHVLILGIDKAGKTTLLEKLKSVYTDIPGLDPNQILPTVGLNVGRMEAYKTPLIFWDLGGQVGLRSIWDKYYKESHAILFVVDSADSNRFQEAKDALERVLSHKELAGAPLLVAANKQDKNSSVSGDVIADQLGVANSHSRPCRVQPVSAFTGEGVRDGVSWIVEEIKKSHRTAVLRKRAIKG